jgi:nucleoside-diphosphate-sugar epimerase
MPSQDCWTRNQIRLNNNENNIKKALVTGGGGYVGAILVPQLLKAGYEVNVIDLFLFGEEVLASVTGHENLKNFKADIRDAEAVTEAVEGCDAVIHLACISNDPSFELDPELGKSINFDAFEPLVVASKEAGVKRFIYASSSSVYGISESPDVDEEHPLNPITDYSRFKADCERVLEEYQTPEFTTVIVRPATVCGYSPRQRLDLIVNILTTHAVTNGRITVFGGDQVRPNLHVQDIVDFYQLMLEAPGDVIDRQIYNVGHENHTVSDLAELVRRVVLEEMPALEEIEIVTTPIGDNRSYQINADKIVRDLDFKTRFSIEDAAREMVKAFKSGRLPDPFEDIRYSNIKTMQAVELK